MRLRKIIYLTAMVVLANVAMLGALGIRSLGLNNLPVGIGVADATQTTERFCSAMNQWDYELVEELINGYSTLHFDKEVESEASNKLIQCLRESYQSQVNGPSVTEGMHARQDIEISYFSVKSASEDIKKYTQQFYDEMLTGEYGSNELYDSDGNVLESVAIGLYEKAIDQITSDPEKYMIKEVITLEMKFENGKWEILLNDDLLRILLGGVSN